MKNDGIHRAILTGSRRVARACQLSENVACVGDPRRVLAPANWVTQVEVQSYFHLAISVLVRRHGQPMLRGPASGIVEHRGEAAGIESIEQLTGDPGLRDGITWQLLGAKILPVEHTIRRWRVGTGQHASQTTCG